MKNKIFLIIIFTCLFCIPNLLVAISGNEIVKKADSYRGLKQEFNLITDMTYYKKDEIKARGKAKVYVKNDRRSLSKILKPRKMKGSVILVTDKNMWVYIPSTRNPIRVSPLQRFMGPASYSDVARVTFAGDYEAKIISLSTKMLGKKCVFLELVGNSRGVAYHKIKYYVEKGTYKPVKAIYFARGGKALKETHFTKYKWYEKEQRIGIIEQVIYDLIKKNNRVVFKYKKPKRGALPNAYFQKHFMKRVR